MCCCSMCCVCVCVCVCVGGEGCLWCWRGWQGQNRREKLDVNAKCKPIFLNVLKCVSKCLVSNFLRAGVLNFVKLF